MRQSRRTVLRTAASVAALPLLGSAGRAQSYPSRPLRIVVGVAAGSPQDILPRLVGQWLSERLGQPVIVENRPGAATNLATEAVVRAPADGYTLLSVAPSSAINATLYEKLSFNVMRDLVPVASLVHQAQVVVINPVMPAKTIPEFIAYNKANPSKINLASSGIGTGNHLAGELFNMLAGVEMVHVPYRGAGPAMTDLIGGQVQVMFVAPVVAVEQIAAGKVRALAVTTATRADVMPELPAVAEFVPGYDFERLVWHHGAQGHAGRNRVEAQSRDQCGPRRSCVARQDRRARRRDRRKLARGLWQADRSRDREVGQGRAIRRHQAGVMRLREVNSARSLGAA